MNLEDAVRRALRDEKFFSNMQQCYPLYSSVGFLSYVREDGAVCCGNVAERIPSLDSEDLLPAISDAMQSYIEGYFEQQHETIHPKKGFVILSKWLSFADNLGEEEQLRKMLRIVLTGKTPEALIHLAGTTLLFEDALQLNKLRRYHPAVALIKGYTAPSRDNDFFFMAYQQREAFEEEEIKEAALVSSSQVSSMNGLQRLYFHDNFYALQGMRDRNGSVILLQ